MKKITQTLEKGIEDILHYDKENAVESVIKSVFETILKLEREEYLANSSSYNKGNGYYQRLIKGINQYLKLRIPRDRMGCFKPVFLEAIKEQDSQIQELAFRLYTKGLSTRDIEQIMEESFGRKMSKSSVSNITKNFEEERDLWLNRSLEKRYLFVYIDALWIPIRRDTVQKEAIYIVLGLKEDLTREVLGVYNIPTESAAGWKEVCTDLKERGLEEVLMIIADGMKGLSEVIGQAFPQARFQKCLVHKMRNILRKSRTQDKKALLNDMQKVFKLEDPRYEVEEGKAILEKFINKWKKIYPGIPRQFAERDLSYYFAYLEFPSKIHRMIYTTNWIERLNKEIRKTERVRNSFPNPNSAITLISACLMNYEKGTYKYPVTAFSTVKDELLEMFDGSQTQFI